MSNLIQFIYDFVDNAFDFIIQMNLLLPEIYDFLTFEILGYGVQDVWISVPVFLVFIGFGFVKTFVPVV